MNIKKYTQEVVNLHTHSYYCGHGFGEVEEYAQAALEQNLQVLGMSEHCPVPDDRWSRTRMPNDLFPNYNQDCLAVQEKYAGKLVVLRSFECDYFKQYHSYFKDYILGELGCDYLLFGVHDLSLDKNEEYSMFWNKLTKKDLFTYTDQYLMAMQSGLFLFGAHPDVFAYKYLHWDSEALACSKAILECAVSCNVALEINANGMRKNKIETGKGSRFAYPLSEFWQLAATYPVNIICNSDAHKPEYVNDKYEACKEFADSHEIVFSSYTVETKESGGHELTIG
jgi:histidinol-phosphatase (PHP family)